MRPNRFLALLADNRKVQGPRGLRVQAADGADEATVYVYDMIVDSALEAEWWGGVAPETFAKELAGITAGTIRLRINSPGGSVFAARAMQAALREHPATVVVHIDGYAASAASVLMLVGDRVIAGDGAMVMIHKAWTLGWGNEDDLRATADLLGKIDGTLVDSYAAKTGRDKDEIAAWMAAETWFTAAEAVEAGLVDEVATDAASAENRIAWNLKALGRPVAPADRAAPPAPSAHAEVAALLRQREYFNRVLPGCR
jgi:ATP-dependent Clp protease protease subunit